MRPELKYSFFGTWVTIILIVLFAFSVIVSGCTREVYCHANKGRTRKYTIRKWFLRRRMQKYSDKKCCLSICLCIVCGNWFSFRTFRIQFVNKTVAWNTVNHLKSNKNLYYQMQIREFLLTNPLPTTAKRVSVQ